ncbi:MAG: energy-coupling factor transporter transmembrane protein EcfT [Clostridia bacterium]|nr:energy-coupling factor transporter transmembrane protein EcfT [Clostridia bacterium]
MLKDITLGQYFPGNSPLHKLDPRMKLILALLFIVTVFFADSLVSVAIMALASFIFVPLGRIPLKTVLRSLKAIRWIILFTSVLNLFWVKTGTQLVDFYFIDIYSGGITYAITMALRVTALLVGSTLLLSYTTSPIALTDGLEQMLSPLKKLHVPVHEFAMMMTIALRFIPTLIEETDKIIAAQKARGADFETGSVFSRAKAMIPIFIPLFVSAIRRADELATAMECRCYHGGDGRTRMTSLRYTPRDFVALGLFLLFMAGIIGMRWLPLPAFLGM